MKQLCFFKKMIILFMWEVECPGYSVFFARRSAVTLTVSYLVRDVFYWVILVIIQEYDRRILVDLDLNERDIYWTKWTRYLLVMYFILRSDKTWPWARWSTYFYYHKIEFEHGIFAWCIYSINVKKKSRPF